MARLALLLSLFIIVILILTVKVDIHVLLYKSSYNIRLDLLFISLNLKGYKSSYQKKRGLLNNRSLIKPLYKSAKMLTKKTDFKINRLVLTPPPSTATGYTRAVPYFASFGALILYIKLTAKSFLYLNNSPTLFTQEESENPLLFDGVLSVRLYYLIICGVFFLYSFLINKISGVKRKWDKAG
jgi:hypothetical protein